MFGNTPSRAKRLFRRLPRGLTLIEMSVAMAIMVLLLAGAVLGIGSFTGSKARGAAGELGGVIRSLYDTAALSGKTCRLVFDLPKEDSSGGAVSYRAECSSGAVTVRQDRDEELADARKKQEKSDQRFRNLSGDSKLEQLMAGEKNRVEEAAKFSSFTSSEIAPRAFPDSVAISVWTQAQRKVVKSGVAYLYFFPQGFTERALIYIRQGDNVWTLTVSPLTGKTAVVAEELELPRT